MWKENTDEMKNERLIKEVSKCVVGITGAPLDAVEVLITEIPKQIEKGWCSSFKMVDK